MNDNFMVEESRGQVVKEGLLFGWLLGRLS